MGPCLASGALTKLAIFLGARVFSALGGAEAGEAAEADAAPASTVTGDVGQGKDSGELAGLSPSVPAREERGSQAEGVSANLRVRGPKIVFLAPALR